MRIFLISERSNLRKYTYFPLLLCSHVSDPLDQGSWNLFYSTIRRLCFSKEQLFLFLLKTRLLPMEVSHMRVQQRRLFWHLSEFVWDDNALQLYFFSLLHTFVFVLACPLPLVTVQYLHPFAIIVLPLYVLGLVCLCSIFGYGRETCGCSLYLLGLLTGGQNGPLQQRAFSGCQNWILSLIQLTSDGICRCHVVAGIKAVVFSWAERLLVISAIGIVLVSWHAVGRVHWITAI